MPIERRLSVWPFGKCVNKKVQLFDFDFRHENACSQNELTKKGRSAFEKNRKWEWNIWTRSDTVQRTNNSVEMYPIDAVHRWIVLLASAQWLTPLWVEHCSLMPVEKHTQRLSLTTIGNVRFGISRMRSHRPFTFTWAEAIGFFLALSKVHSGSICLDNNFNWFFMGAGATGRHRQVGHFFEPIHKLDWNECQMSLPIQNDILNISQKKFVVFDKISCHDDDDKSNAEGKMTLSFVCRKIKK